MRLLPRIAGSRIAGFKSILPLAILAVAGPVVVVSAGFWDAISHILQEPEFFWSAPHIVVYAGVSMTACAGILGGVLLVRGTVRGIIRTGIKLVIVGGAIQMASGFADSMSHDMFGIDGLVSWSHQPLEFGLVLGISGRAANPQGNGAYQAQAAAAVFGGDVPVLCGVAWLQSGLDIRACNPVHTSL